MADLSAMVIQARSPLANMAADMKAASSSAVSFEEVPFLAHIVVRGNADDPAFLAGIKSVLGTDLPVKPNTTAKADDLSAYWMSPDEWFIVGPDEKAESLAADLEKALAGQHVSIVDTSNNRTTVDVSGEKARTLLEKSMIIDLHPSAFKPGDCANTLFGSAQVLFEQTGETSYRLFPRSSFAAYLAAYLIDGAAEFA